jgi:hypothetical protein
MTSGTAGSNASSAPVSQDHDPADSAPRPGDLAALARDLVDKVGIEGAVRYCRSLGWGGVLDQVELLRRSH